MSATLGTLTTQQPGHAAAPSSDSTPSSRRQRRRLGTPEIDAASPASSATTSQAAGPAAIWSEANSSDSEEEEELRMATGQLSLNEDEQVRYHGKVSGLYMLGKRVDARNEAGIWYVAAAEMLSIVFLFWLRSCSKALSQGTGMATSAGDARKSARGRLAGYVCRSAASKGTT